ncbi:YcxB family protein [Paenibacillus kobensis]|uniref:YcxB family protein n=1 Tax=Paenibacillus kobensis TaxID=59841 RepID=UPI000FDAB4E1|nr:YcxB family protein [Paenibacillus kobensis]
MKLQEVSVQVQLSNNDLRNFQMSTLCRQAFIWVYAVLLVGSISYIVYSAVNNQIEDVPMMAWIIMFVGLALLLTLFTTMQKAKKSRFLKEIKTYTVTDETVKMESESLAANLKWEDFVKYLKTKQAIYLYMNANSAHVLPVRDLSGEEIQFIVELAKAKIKRKSRWTSLGFRFLFYILIFLITVGLMQYLTR